MTKVIPKKAVKTAVSLPADTYRRAEALRRKSGKTRSELYSEALQRMLKAEEIREKEARYEAGYRAKPETEEELKVLDAFSRLSAEAMSAEFGDKEDW